MLKHLEPSLFALAALLAVPVATHANHGPGTSGGGSATITGETLDQGRWDLSLRTDYTNFQNISRAGAERRAAFAGGFDALQESYLYTASLSYGVTDDLQLSATIGYYRGNGFIDAESEDGDVESSLANPSGLTDLTLSAKYRVLQGQPGNLSLIGGLIIPTGKNDVQTSSGEVLEPSSQPGTGAFALQVGVAYSRYLTPRVTMDASALYTYRFDDGDGFSVGDRVDLGVAAAYRLTESVKTFPNVSVFGELNAVWLGKDDSSGDKNPNSGGWIVYATPGARVRFSETVAMTVAPSFPIIVEENGEQVQPHFKLAVTLSLTF